MRINRFYIPIEEIDGLQDTLRTGGEPWVKAYPIKLMMKTMEVGELPPLLKLTEERADLLACKLYDSTYGEPLNEELRKQRSNWLRGFKQCWRMMVRRDTV
jgi:hypothetical protein